MYSDFLWKKLSNSVFGFPLLYTIIDQICLILAIVLVTKGSLVIVFVILKIALAGNKWWAGQSGVAQGGLPANAIYKKLTQ